MYFFVLLETIDGLSLSWEAISTIILVITTIVGVIIWLGKKFVVAPLKQEIRQLEREIDTRLQLPSYSLDAIRLNELATERKIDEIQNDYENALEKKDKQSAEELSKHLQEIEKLRNSLDEVSSEYAALQRDLQASLISREYTHSENALGLPTGFILLIKCEGNFGALKAIDQSWSKRRGAFIKYYWWYQPNGTGFFTTPEVQSGFDKANESGKGSYLLKIGPILLPWSAGSEGKGWVYFENASDPTKEIELVISNEIDITRINAANYNFLKPFKGKPKRIKPRNN